MNTLSAFVSEYGSQGFRVVGFHDGLWDVRLDSGVMIAVSANVCPSDLATTVSELSSLIYEPSIACFETLLK